MSFLVVVMISNAFELAFQVLEEPHDIVLGESGKQGERPAHHTMSVPALYSFGADNVAAKRLSVCCGASWRRAIKGNRRQTRDK